LPDLRQGDLGQRRYRDAPLPSPLSVWFWAAFLMATHSNGMSAMQLKSELGLGSYHTAWLLAMSDLERRAITGSRRRIFHRERREG